MPSPDTVGATASVPPVGIKVSHNLWAVWLQIAHAHLVAAQEARNASSAAVQAGDTSPAAFEFIRAEQAACMVSIASVAFALDGIYPSLRDYAPAVVPPAIVDRWKRKKTPRSAQLIETAKAGFKIEKWVQQTKATRRIEEIFALRGEMVHHEPKLGDPVAHPVWPGFMNAETATYTVERAADTYEFAREFLTMLVQNPKPRRRAWAAAYAHVIGAL